ncbi:MAG: glycosyltransferase family 4 protein [Candidatus Bipolaricaulis anaerobius]|nr:glycosyltransferase family 4 protein [Candidatus Bipolaricaulis anaerobius]
MNNCTRDARVLKEAGSLAREGLQVTVVAVFDKATTCLTEERNGFTIVRVVRDHIHYKAFRLARIPRKISRKVQRVSKKAIRWSRKQLLRLRNSRMRFRRTILDTMSRWQLGAKCFLAHLVPRLGVPTQGDAQGDAQSRKGRTGIGRIAGVFLLPVLLFRSIALFVSNNGRVAVQLVRSIHSTCTSQMHRLLMVFHRSLMFLDYWGRAYRLALEEPADVYHAHDLNTLPVAWWAARSLGGKLVYDSHELYTETSNLSRRERWTWRQLERFLIRRCDAVITVNDSIAAELQVRYGIPLPTVVMNCPVISEKVDRTTHLRDAVGVAEDEAIVLYHGGFSAHRGLHNLISAMALVPMGKLVMMGWGRIEEELRRFAEAQGLLGTKVFFLPPVSQEELLSWTASADVGVIPYQPVGLNNYYSLPNKLFEYLGAGLPVAVSNLPELARVVDTHKVGYTFNPDDPQDIARAIIQIIGDPGHLAELKKRALAARERFSWQVEERKLLNIYERLRT